MLRSVIAPVLGICIASTVLGLLCNALREHDQIEIARAYFAPAAPPLAGPRGGDGAAAAPDPAAAADLAARAAREFTLVDADRVLEFLAVADVIPGYVVLVDARGDALFRHGHIPGALQIDYFNIRRYIEPSLPFLPLISWLVVYCESSDCEDGLLLCRVLRDEYRIPSERLLLYVGGMQEWRQLGHPITRGVEQR